MRRTSRLHLGAPHGGWFPLSWKSHESEQLAIGRSMDGNLRKEKFSAGRTKQRVTLGILLSILLAFGNPAYAQFSAASDTVRASSGAGSLREDVNDGSSATRPPGQHASHTLRPSADTATASQCQPSAFGASTAERGMSLRRQKTEWDLGKQLSAEVERHTPLVKDPRIIEYLNRLELGIVRNSDLTGCFAVKVINDVDPNAYSLPGGFLYVTSGLILSAENEAELVGALAHETGHVTARHFTRVDWQRRIWRRLTLAAGPPGYVLRRSLGRLLFLKLLRNAEFEADRLGVGYEGASGYDPAEFSQLLRAVVQREGTPPSFFERIFEAHPSTGSRLKRTEEMSGGLRPPPNGYVVDTSEFHEVKMRMTAMMHVPQAGVSGRTSD